MRVLRGGWKAYKNVSMSSRLPIQTSAGEFPPERAARIDPLAAELASYGFEHVLDVEPTDPEAAITNVGTLNPESPSIFDRPPWLKITTRPGAGVLELVAAQREAVTEIPSAPAPPWDGDPLQAAASENAAVLAYQTKRGLLRDSQEGTYSYSPRGAARSVFRVWRSERE